MTSTPLAQRHAGLAVSTLTAFGLALGTGVGTSAAATSPGPGGPGPVLIPHEIVNRGSGHCLRARSTASSSYVDTWSCNSSSTVQWYAGFDGTLRTEAGLCLRPKATNPGSYIEVSTCKDEAAEKWHYRNDETLYNPNTNLCLGVKTNGYADIHTCNNQNHEKWTFKRAQEPGGAQR